MITAITTLQNEPRILLLCQILFKGQFLSMDCRPQGPQGNNNCSANGKPTSTQHSPTGSKKWIVLSMSLHGAWGSAIFPWHVQLQQQVSASWRGTYNITRPRRPKSLRFLITAHCFILKLLVNFRLGVGNLNDLRPWVHPSLEQGFTKLIGENCSLR